MSCVYTLTETFIKPFEKFKFLIQLLEKEMPNDLAIMKETDFKEVSPESEVMTKIYIKFITRHLNEIVNDLSLTDFGSLQFIYQSLAII